MQNITVRFGETARLNCSMASQDHHLSTVEWLRQTSVNTTDDDSMRFQSSPFFEVLDVSPYYLIKISTIRPHRFLDSQISAIRHFSKHFIKQVDYSGGKDRQILSIENVTHEDDGKYLCLVTNKNGKSVQSSWLIVGTTIFYTYICIHALRIFVFHFTVYFNLSFIDDARQTETLQDWLTVQVSMAGAVGGAIAITSIASLFILIRINK